MQSSDNVFHTLYKLVAEIFKDFESPKCSLQLFKSDKTYEENAMHKVKTISANCDPNSNISQSEKPIMCTDIYKYRSSRKERVFVPPARNKNSKVSQETSDGFTVYNNDFDYVNNTNFMNTLEDKKYINIYEEGESQFKSAENKNKSPLTEFKFITDNIDLSKRTEDHISKKRINDVIYLPLKVKCIQGSNNRIKATKIVKKKK